MNYQVITAEGRKPIKAWVKGVELEDAAKQQLINVAGMPFIHKHIAVMPDVHFGKGATVGSVIPTRGAIIPAAVGVDLGCGMQAIRIAEKSEVIFKDRAALRSLIEQAVPHGRTDNGGRNDRGAWGEPPKHVLDCWANLAGKFEFITAKHPAIARANSLNHLGTLGGGNHFVEVCLDKQDRVWIMLHSGSRGIGNKIGSYFIERAQKMMETYFIALEDKDLAYIPEGVTDFEDYIEAMLWAQDFARWNRQAMRVSILTALRNAGFNTYIDEQVDCHHNFCAIENHFGENIWVTRKGAVRARSGDAGIIPGSMGARSFIVRGKGNADSFNSCSHGAGRRMSRAEAKRRFTVEDHIKATEGIECRKDDDVRDETPGAYKDIDAVMNAQSDLVEIVHELRQLVCVKG